MFCLIVDREPAKKVVIFTSVISLLHAVVNPPLYAWMSQRYRQGYLFVFKMALSVCGGTRPNRRSLSKGLFTWREGTPTNRATRLQGLKHNPPLPATHLTGTVSGLRELSPERPLSTTNITADQGNVFPSYFSFLHRHGPVLFLRLVYYIDLLRMTVILFGR